jgi:RimJ/RimL family protein N-acetyltransferase
VEGAGNPATGIRITLRAFELRQFRAEDTAALYAVRNHDSVRGLLADPRPIPYDSHVEWVNRNLLPGRDILLFLARSHAAAIGLTLLKRLAADTVEVGVMFREARRHPVMPAQAAVIMLYLAFEHFGMSWAVSYVLPQHDRAIALNAGLGGEKVASDKSGMLCFRQHRAAVLRNRHYRQLLARIVPTLSILTE